MNIKFGPTLNTKNEKLLRLWEHYQQRRAADPAIEAFLTANTRAAALIQEAFAPHDLHKRGFCAHLHLEAVQWHKFSPVGMKFLLKNSVKFPDFGKLYLFAYKVIESACSAHRCRHRGECPKQYPAEPKSRDRGTAGIHSLIDALRNGGRATPLSAQQLASARKTVPRPYRHTDVDEAIEYFESLVAKEKGKQ